MYRILVFSIIVAVAFAGAAFLFLLALDAAVAAVVASIPCGR